MNLFMCLQRGHLRFFFPCKSLRILFLLMMLSPGWLDKMLLVKILELWSSTEERWVGLTGWGTESKQAWEKVWEKNTERFPLQKNALVGLGSLPDLTVEPRFPESAVSKSLQKPLKNVWFSFRAVHREDDNLLLLSVCPLSLVAEVDLKFPTPQWFVWVSVLLYATESLSFFPIWWFRKLENDILRKYVKRI